VGSDPPTKPRSQRFPYRLVSGVLPLHTIREVRPEIHLAWLRLTRRGIDARFEDGHNLLVNVGCGSLGLDDWVNIDCYPAKGVTCVRDCRTSLPLSDGSARGIFTEHFFEHLDYYDEAPRFLAECRRVLQPGGVLRIIVPDGAKYMRAYFDSGWTAMRTFSPIMSASDFRTKMEVVNAHFRQGGQHRFSYDYETLSRLLQDNDLTEINERAYRSSSVAELEIDSEERASESLVVEAARAVG
jgi:predicted SAM-dependent methyltransferase